MPQNVLIAIVPGCRQDLNDSLDYFFFADAVIEIDKDDTDCITTKFYRQNDSANRLHEQNWNKH